MWRYSPAAATWLPVEFVEAASVADELGEFVRAELPAMAGVLAEAAAYLEANGLQDVFGIALLHRGGIFGGGEPGPLWETEGPSPRTLVLGTAPMPEAESSEWMETLWHFENGRAQANVFCQGHTVTVFGRTCPTI
jgi:hypothetical protein